MDKETITNKLPKIIAFIDECAKTLHMVIETTGINYSECGEELYTQLLGQSKNLDTLTTETLITLLKTVECTDNALEPCQRKILLRELRKHYIQRGNLLYGIEKETGDETENV